jgi:hypothetical protein
LHYIAPLCLPPSTYFIPRAYPSSPCFTTLHSTSFLESRLYFSEAEKESGKMASSNSTYDAQASTNYKEAFALFDKRGTQRVALESLGDLLRACGQNPTLAEIRDLEKNVGGDCTYSLFPLHSPLLVSPIPNPAQQTPPLPSTQFRMHKKHRKLMSYLHSRFRNLLQDPQPPRRLPRSRRAGGILPRLPGLRQGHDRFHWCWSITIYFDEFGREDE